MIRTLNLNDKTYEDRINEAIASIPIYTDEWTNYNPSDPGITILENLSLFETLQQDNINDIPLSVKTNLLKMAGFVPAKGKSAKVLVMASGLKENIIIPRGQKFYIYDVPFETVKPTKVYAGSITNICTKYNDEKFYFSHLQKTPSYLESFIFTKTPKVGMELYIYTDMLPDPGSEFIMYAHVKGSKKRNDIDPKDKDIFSAFKWEYYTKDGFEKIHAKDSTHGFIKSGEIRVRIGDKWPAKYADGDDEGYCIRVTLTESSYDEPPALTQINGFLFELTQLETKSFNISGVKASSIELLTAVEKNNYISVFVKEEKSGSYRRYIPVSNTEKDTGRYYTVSEDENGLTTYHFSKAKFGYAPFKGRACIRVLVYNEEVMRRYQIGKVLGYDDQEFSVPFKNIVNESFSIVARRVDENGEYIYDFVRPSKTDIGNLHYVLNDRDGVIIIKDAGDFIGAELFMAGCAVYLGDAGNVRADNQLITNGLPKGVSYVNPAAGHGGVFPETIEQVRQRFIEDINMPYAAITAEDYEYLALTTSGLCIKKAKAHFDESESRVYVAVLPGYGQDDYPMLSDDYIKRISERINERRLLTTKLSVGRTIPVPVNVRATVYVKQHYEDCEQIIVRELEKLLNYPASEHNIGDSVRFDEVYKCIENLACVEFVHSLNLRSSRNSLLVAGDMDIHPVWNGLVVPGHISIDTISYNG